MKALLWAAISLAMILYPLGVYFGLQHWGPGSLALALATLVFARAVYFWRELTLKSCLFPAALIAFCLLVTFYDSLSLLKYYPVLMSCAVAGAFLASLSGEEPLLEKAARLSGKTITPRAKGYLRKLTIIWSVVILVNATVAAYSACCGSMDFWGLYNGVVSYAIFGLLFVGEWFYRQYYIRRYEGEEAAAE